MTAVTSAQALLSRLNSTMATAVEKTTTASFALSSAMFEEILVLVNFSWRM
jgi:hypothetical protein